MNKQQIIRALEAAHSVAAEAMTAGRHPFGAVLIGPDGSAILMRQGNEGTVRHAETELARRAAEQYEADYLVGCTLATNFEPCAMCAGTIYWANIGRVIYGASESRLLELTGAHEENPTLNLPCRSVFESGQKTVEVIGPVAEMEAAILKLHEDFWS
ncbi:MAG: nucleoside deaminase [Verrucomicrobia bacterium]|jgi:tRNA(Arg) A34 adenosine deaminase TadA|nr:nucleoside deaminase [Verrucomicrobiota bacterium]